MIVQIINKDEKGTISRTILESLTEWFEIEESREKYIVECVDQIFIAAKEDGMNVGFLCLKETAKDIAFTKGYSFLQVKTVEMGKYDDYDKTNLFYLSCGFREFEVFPTLWDVENPCQVYVMSLR